MLVRGGAGQVMFEIQVDGERFIRLAGDGLARRDAARLERLHARGRRPDARGGDGGLVLTPLAPHGGVCPPLVTGPETEVTVILETGNGGARVELDGQVHSSSGSARR